MVPSDTLFSQKVVVIASDSFELWGIMQSRIHEVWVRMFTSTLEDRLNYSASDCFENFPLPKPAYTDPSLLAVGVEYHSRRASIMVRRGEGLTNIYNRFHNALESTSDVLQLRELHHQLDVAVLRTYGWDDLANRATPAFLTEETEPDHRYQSRLFWSASFRDEVLARLLDLNMARAAEERALGLSPTGLGDRGDQDEAA